MPRVSAIRIESMPRPGDRRTTGKSGKMIRLVLRRPRRFADLFSAIQSDDPGVRMRAADAAEKFPRHPPAWQGPYKKLLINKIARIPQQEVRCHVAQMLPRPVLTGAERKKVFELLLRYLKDDSRIGKSFTTQAIADLAAQGDAHRDQARDLNRHLTATGTPAMMARGKMLLRGFRHDPGRAKKKIK